MVGLILLYFAGKAFYNLAEQHNRSKWGFAILGVASYYGGLLLGAVIIALVYEFGFSKSADDINDTLLGVMAMPVGVLVCWGFYKGLQATWSKSSKPFESEDVLDAELLRKEDQE